VRLGVVGLVEVDAECDGHVGVLGRRRDDHLRRARVEVLGGAVAAAEAPARLDRDLHAELPPGKLSGIGLGQHHDRAVAHAQVVTVRLHLRGEMPEHRVTPQQLRQRLDVHQVVDRDDLQVGVALERCPQRAATGPAKAVDSHSYRHG
jgi:hypothetical protein